MIDPINTTEQGGISVDTAHIFPIIKRWLYSEKDIFLREIVSNASDAITKMIRLCSLGETECSDKYKISVKINADAGTLTVEDNGIGMTAEELKRYICQIALSGALEFIDKYEGSTDNSQSSGIIGHFGLGFYSAFMISDKVEIFTRSYTNAPAVHWTCSDDGNYEISAAYREERGTAVIMHVTEDEKDYLNIDKIRALLDKYCAFMPYEIYLENQAEDNVDSAAPINTTSPLWLKRPSDCTEEEYKQFYHKVFSDFNDPLFSIHINADYPLNFKGILYFPKLRSEYDSLEGQIKLFYNQVFVADNVKEIIPEYLIMLKGVIDCPELPLNVSRSYLQSNTYVSRVSAHIVKKIADKINALCNNEREQFEKIWGDIRTFIEYASIRDRKFFDRVKDCILLPLTDGSYATINEYIGKEEKEPPKDDSKCIKTIYYTNDKIQQSQYIALYTAQNIKVAVLDQFIDTQFITSAENEYKNIRFVRVDADVSALTDQSDISENTAIAELFKQAVGNDKLDVKFESLKTTAAPALLTLNEDKRRMDDFMKAYSYITQSEQSSAPLTEQTLIVNTAAPLYSHLEQLIANKETEKSAFVANYIYKLSLMAHRRLEEKELNEFLSDSYKLLNNY